MASASDDETIRIWKKSEKEEDNEEEENDNIIRYECAHIFKGHHSDVTDLSWSPDSRFLCSASVDCRVLVWSLEEETPVHTLEGHAAWVSSVDWDPCGEFIASVAKDNTLKLWSTSSFACAKTVEALQSDQYGSGLYKEARWSPDGSTLCVTHAVYKQFPSALLLARGSWAPQVVLAGHAAIVGSARYAPSLVVAAGAARQLLALGGDVGAAAEWQLGRRGVAVAQRPRPAARRHPRRQPFRRLRHRLEP